MKVQAQRIARFLFKDLVGSVAWFPVWWYTAGFLGMVSGMKDALAYRIKSAGFSIWLKNFFVPMYGQTDLAGRLISIFMRFAVLVGQSIILVVETVIYSIGVAVWVLAPVTFFVLALLSFLKGVAVHPPNFYGA